MLLLFLIGCSYTVEKVYEHSYNYISFCDVDDDSIDEMFFNNNGSIGIQSLKKIYIWENYYNKYFAPITASDIDGDGKKEIIMMTVSPQKPYILYAYIIYSDMKDYFIAIDTLPDTKPPYGPDSKNINPLFSVVIDSFLYCIYNAGYDLKPRALYKINLKRRKRVWKFSIGPVIANVKTRINKDGKREFLLSTGAVSNGNKEKDMDDTKSYVIVVNGDGTLKWKRITGRYFSHNYVVAGDIDGDGKKEVVVAVYGGPEERKTGDKIYIYTDTGKKIKTINNPYPWTGVECSDLNNDGKDEIIATDNSGKISIYSKDRFIKERKWKCGLTLKMVVDIDGNGRKEIVVESDNHNLLIFNSRLHLLTSYYMGEKTHIYPQTIQKKKERILTAASSAEARKMKISLFELEKSFFPDYFTFGIILLLIVLFYTAVVIYDKQWIRIFYSLPLNICLIKRRKIVRGKGILEKFTGKFLASVFDKTRLRKEGTIHIDGFPYKYICLRLGFHSLLILTDISGYLFMEWTEMVQELLHSLKNPLTTILLNLERLKKQIGDDKKIIRSLEETERLKELTSRLMRFIGMKKAKRNENVEIKDIIEKILFGIPSNIEVQKEYMANPVIMGDKKRIREAFANIITNAIEAMPNGGKLFVRIDESFLIGKGKHIEINITDTGNGIPEEYKDKLFKPFFTLKPKGVGLGLFITRRIIEEHNGKIEILSREVGTTIKVKFLV